MKKHLFALPILVTSLFIFSCATSKTEPEGQEETPPVEIVPEKKSISFDYKLVTENKTLDYFEYELQYPVFENNAVLNSEIKNKILDPIYKTVSESKSDYEMGSPFFESQVDDLPRRYEAFCSVENIFDSGDVISIVMNTYTYLGGAHGNPETETINYSKSKNKILSIEEASGMSLENISRLCYECLLDAMSQNEMSDIQWIQTGTEPESENFQAFSVEGKILTVYFNPYQVAPYAYGILSVIIEL